MVKRQSYLVLVYLLMVILSLTNGRKVPCEWSPSSGQKYDFSSLYRKDGYKLKDPQSTLGMFDLLLITNVCETVSCLGQDVSLYEGLEILGELSSSCDVLTFSTQPVYSYINTNIPALGVQWKHTGDACLTPTTISYDSSNNPVISQASPSTYRTSTYQINCSDRESETFSVEGSDTCHTLFKMNSRVGCIGQDSSSSFSSFKFLLCLLVLIGAYFCIGSLLNNRKHGLTGIESLPHSAFLREFPQLVNDGIKYSILKTTSLIRNIKGSTTSSFSNQPGTYNII